MQYIHIVNAIKMSKQLKRKVTIRRKKTSNSKVTNRSSTAWRIIGSEGEVLSSIKTGTSRRHFLATETSTKSKEETEGILVFGQIKPMIHYLGYSQQEIADVLEVDPSTLSRWKKEDKPIGKLRSKAMYDIDHIIAKGIRIFGSEATFKDWLNTTNYALGDKKPIELMKDPYGIELVDDAVEAMSWGNFI